MKRVVQEEKGKSIYAFFQPILLVLQSTSLCIKNVNYANHWVIQQKIQLP